MLRQERIIALVLFEARRFTALLFCLVGRDVKAKRGAPDSPTFCRQFGMARCGLIRVLGRLCVKCADLVGAGVMLRQERSSLLFCLKRGVLQRSCFVWWVVTSGRKAVHWTRWLLVGNSGVVRCGLIRVSSRLCVKCADSVGAGVMLRQERSFARVLFEAKRFTALLFCLVGRGVRPQCGHRFADFSSAIRCGAL
jgi:hypothetical protein